VAYLVEGLVAVGRELAGHPQHALADDVALHLVAPTTQAVGLA
jgi:hypothetical protein